MSPWTDTQGDELLYRNANGFQFVYITGERLSHKKFNLLVVTVRRLEGHPSDPNILCLDTIRRLGLRRDLRSVLCRPVKYYNLMFKVHNSYWKYFSSVSICAIIFVCSLKRREYTELLQGSQPMLVHAWIFNSFLLYYLFYSYYYKFCKSYAD